MNSGRNNIAGRNGKVLVGANQGFSAHIARCLGTRKRIVTS